MSKAKVGVKQPSNVAIINSNSVPPNLSFKSKKKPFISQTSNDENSEFEGRQNLLLNYKSVLLSIWIPKEYSFSYLIKTNKLVRVLNLWDNFNNMQTTKNISK